MDTVTFGAARQRMNMLVEMYAQAKVSSDELRRERIFEQIYSLILVAAKVYASKNFGSLSDYEREVIQSQVSDRLVKMVNWYDVERGIPFTGFVGKEFQNHPNPPTKGVIEREIDTTFLTQIDLESGEEYLPKGVSDAFELLTINPRQSAQIVERFARLKNCLGEDDPPDNSLLEKWGVVLTEDLKDIQAIPMRFRASVFFQIRSAASPTKPPDNSCERNLFISDPYFKRSMWI